MNPPRCAALLLAGGTSRRMGRPKALLEIAGEPLWQIQARKLAAHEPDELLLSLPAGLAIPPGEWQIVRDETPGLGPLAGLESARRAMTADWLIVLAVDLPRMSADYLASLRDRGFASGVGQVPELDGRYLGLAAIYPRPFLDRYLPTHLQGEDRSIQRLVRAGIADGSLEAVPVADPEHPLFHNVNTPEDLEL